jgi:DNA-binding PadR family transcriptional regulator
VSVRLGLLALLDGADMYGYQLKVEFEAHTGGVWPLNIGQVYSTLDRLERDRLVAVVAPSGGDDEGGQAKPGGGREQKYYAITRAGRDALADWFAATAGDEPPPRDELLAKVLLALAGGRDHALGVVTAQRTALTGALQARRRALRERKAAAGPGGDRDGGAAAVTRVLAGELVADALVTRAEADLRWLDLCEARLVRLADDQAPGPPGADRPGGRP